MPINPRHEASATYMDYSEELSSATVNVGAITALTIAAFLTQLDAFFDAQQALSLGALQKTSWTGDITSYSGAPPSDLNAQRERKWRVEYEDATTLAKYQYEIPVALVTGQLIPHTDKADLTTAEWVAFITAFETLCKSPEGNTVNVLRATLVGRNL